MSTGFVTAGNLGADFDVGTQVAGKLNIVPATNAVSGKMRFATSAEAAAATAGTVMDSSQVGAALGAATAPLAPKASPTLSAATLTGITATADQSKSGAQAIPLSLTSQPATAYGSYTFTVVTNQASVIEFVDAGEMRAQTGASATSYNRAKVNLYRSAIGYPTGGDIYAANFVGQSNAGHGGDNIVLELDFNDANSSGTSGNVVSQTNFGNLASGNLPVRAPLYVAGSTSNPCSGAMLVNMTGQLIQPYRILGVYCGLSAGGSAAIPGAIIDDDINAASIILSTGTKNVPFDCRALSVTSTVFMWMPKQVRLRWNNSSSGTIDIYPNAGNSLIVGEGSAGVAISSNLAPTGDNVYSCGLGSVRWSTGYFAGGTATSSDRELKDDIAAIPDDAFALVMALVPSSWRWKVGGKIESEVDEEVDVAETDAEGGIVYRYEPWVDADGKPRTKVLHGAPAQAELWGEDKDGKPVLLRPATAATPDRTVAMTRAIPATVKGTRKVKVYADRPGKRRHAGFIYQDVAKALADKGVDYGICDATPDGGYFLRTDKLVPLLMKAFQVHVATTEKTIRDLTARLALLEKSRTSPDPHDQGV